MLMRVDTSGFRIEPQDEYTHAPDAAANFNESVYMNAFDAAQRLGGWMRLGNRVNEGYAELSVCLYLPDGRVACRLRLARPLVGPSLLADDLLLPPLHRQLRR
jgi:hypothetical protein